MENRPYALMAFDLYSLCDMIQDRLTAAQTNSTKRDAGTFFNGKKNIGTQIGVLQAAISFIDRYIEGTSTDKQSEYRDSLNEFKECFENAINARKTSRG